ncbi:toxin biosynthesis protein [Aspergillus costaricaensis CBS 115574]|uniref:Toxin biosynthesis protein n=1 Tax=Aspergillus costaricaensis CBS 115574 TaxID=1448317 RepID=A0ACD1IHQ4_9EURO|nr:toxin biosynthesis protein [Aspergillus costaricaensis CBS 115574]RAK89826.1 toxin biosynthesis protein [Aspergillus costaricaensis CBS 115574]
MESSPFNITEHVVDCQHIREYARATRDSNDALKIAVKQYTPKSNPNPQPGDVTIIGATSVGSPKELKEPLWEEIYERLSRQGLRIRSIWIADSAPQAESAAINAEYLGFEPSWFDHSRDLLYMINQYKDDMPKPIIGVGHSIGVGQLLGLTQMHPRLFTSLILIEPVIVKEFISGRGPGFAKAALMKKDTWKSRAEADSYFRETLNEWDPRCLDLWLKYGLRDNTAETENSESTVGLATTKDQEIAQSLRPNFIDLQPGSNQSEYLHDPSFWTDVTGHSETLPFYRYEPIVLWKLLKYVRPSVLWIYGGKSIMATPDQRAEKLQRTGTGVGGSGGYEKGRVKEIVIPNGGHFVPFEDVAGVAGPAAEWIKQETDRWHDEEERIKKGWLDLTAKQRSSIPNEWLAQMDKYFMKGKARKAQVRAKL